MRTLRISGILILLLLMGLNFSCTKENEEEVEFIQGKWKPITERYLEDKWYERPAEDLMWEFKEKALYITYEDGSTEYEGNWQWIEVGKKLKINNDVYDVLTYTKTDLDIKSHNYQYIFKKN